MDRNPPHLYLYFNTSFGKSIQNYYIYFTGSHGIEPTRDWIHFLKTGFLAAGGGFYTYYNLQCIILDKEIKNIYKKISVMKKKHLTQCLNMGSIPRLYILLNEFLWFKKKILDSKKLSETLSSTYLCHQNNYWLSKNKQCKISYKLGVKKEKFIVNSFCPNQWISGQNYYTVWEMEKVTLCRRWKRLHCVGEVKGYTV